MDEINFEELFRFYVKEGLTSPVDVLGIAQLLPYERLCAEGFALDFSFRAARYPDDSAVNKKAVWLTFENKDGNLVLNPEITAKFREHELRVNAPLKRVTLVDRLGDTQPTANNRKYNLTNLRLLNQVARTISIVDLIAPKQPVWLPEFLAGCTDVPEQEFVERHLNDLCILADAEMVELNYRVVGGNVQQFGVFLQNYLPALLAKGYTNPFRNGTMVCKISASREGNEGVLLSDTTSYGFQLFPGLASEAYKRNTRKTHTRFWRPLEVRAQILTEEETVKVLTRINEVGYNPVIDTYTTCLKKGF